MQSITHLIKNQDQISLLPAQRFHFGNKHSHKTVLGGCCTILAFVMFVVFAVYQAIPIWNRTYPFISTQEKNFNADEFPTINFKKRNGQTPNSAGMFMLSFYDLLN